MRHHFVPQFLLTRWATNGRVLAYRWIERIGRVVVSPTSVAECCQIEDLHAYFGLSRESRNTPETDYFTPQIDTPAAGAHAAFLKGGVECLTPEQRTAWARFLLAFGVRTPETLRLMGPKHFRIAMASDLANPRAPVEIEARVNAAIADAMPRLARNVPLNIAMELSSDGRRIAAVRAMDWWLTNLDQGSAVLSDRPLLCDPSQNWPCGIGYDNPACTISIPIAPNVVFHAANDFRTRSRLSNMSSQEIRQCMNAASIDRAVEFIYANDRANDSFVRKKLAGHKSIWPLQDMSIRTFP
jgi:hypothetical protein